MKETRTTAPMVADRVRLRPGPSPAALRLGFFRSSRRLTKRLRLSGSMSLPLQELSMRTYIGRQQAISAGTSRNWRSVPRLSCGSGSRARATKERAAREDAARDILADDPDLPDDLIRIAAQVIEVYNPDLFDVIPLTRPARRRRAARKGVAA